MGQKITVALNGDAPYERVITGANGCPPIDEKDDVVLLSFTMPNKAGAKLQFAEYGEGGGKARWIVTTGPANPFPVNGQQTGTLNFVTGEAQPGTNEMQTPAGTPVTVKVYQYDPATVPTHGKSWNDPRNMVFDYSSY